MDEDVEQEAAVFLRERFLKLIGSKLAGRTCTIEMFETTSLDCKIRSIDPKFDNIIVEDLKTPLRTVLKYAKLRTNDMISLQLPNM